MNKTGMDVVLRRIGSNIRAERARNHLTQEALAHQSGVAVAQVARMERGVSDTGISKYVLLARALNIKPSLFFEDVE